MNKVDYSLYLRRDELSESAIIRYLANPQVIKHLDNDQIKAILNYAKSLKIIPFEILKKTLTVTNANKKVTSSNKTIHRPVKINSNYVIIIYLQLKESLGIKSYTNDFLS
jgi:hypothetical protein